MNHLQVTGEELQLALDMLAKGQLDEAVIHLETLMNECLIVQCGVRTFSGETSKSLWQNINRVKPSRARLAAYSIACRCQELESMVYRLEARITQLETDS